MTHPHNEPGPRDLRAGLARVGAVRVARAVRVPQAVQVPRGATSKDPNANYPAPQRR